MWYIAATGIYAALGNFKVFLYNIWKKGESPMQIETRPTGGDGAFMNSYSRSGAIDTPQLRARRKLQLALAVLANLAIVLMEAWANLALWNQHPVFKDLVIFYTHQSNFLALIASALFVLFGTVALFRDGRIPRLVKVFRLMCAVQLYITFIVVLVGLGPMTALAGGDLFAMYGGPMFVMHLMGPIVSLVSFVLLEGTPRLTLGDAFLAIQYTWIYSIVMVILNAVGKVDGPYPFLMVDVNPWWVSLLYAIVMIPGGLLTAFCGKWLNNGIACRIAGEEPFHL